MSNKKEKVEEYISPKDKADEFLKPFNEVLKKHSQIHRIRIEGEKTNIVIERKNEIQSS